MSNPTRQEHAARQKILIVDDKEANLFALKKILKDIDAEILRALDGQTALIQVLNHDFALIILDVRMPGMDGYEVAKHLQGDSSTKNIPIIFVTAEYPDEEHMFRGYQAGAIDYMLKPYSSKILLSKVNILLEMDRTRAELQQHRDELEELVTKRTTELSSANEELLQYSWLLEKEQGIKTESVDPAYDDVTTLNRDGLILNAVGADTLKQMSKDIMNLLDTSLAVYEKNGDYALEMFVSGWCGTLNNASRALCETNDNRKALDCGKWLCHENCWKISKAALDSDEPVDEACCGEIRMYAVPILSGNQTIGVISIGYGTPPQTAAEQKALAEVYHLDLRTIQHNAESYKPRPPFIINVAKHRLQSIARLIGEIVERKESEEALSKSEVRYNQLACQNRIIVWEVDTNGLYTYCSNVVRNVLGYRPDEIVGLKHFYDLHPEKERDVFKKSALEFFSSKKVFQSLENQRETKEDRVVWVLTTAIPLLNEQGELLGYRGSDTDITERKQAEDALQISEQRFRSIFEVADVGIAEVSLKGTYLQINQKLCDILNYSKDELKKLSFQDITHPDDLATDLDFVQEMLDGKRAAYTMEKRYIRKDGSPVWIQLTVSLIHKANGTPDRFISIIEDIDSRKKLEGDLKEKIRELERFNKASVGRELRMIELKKEITELHHQRGDDSPYGSTK